MRASACGRLKRRSHLEQTNEEQFGRGAVFGGTLLMIPAARGGAAADPLNCIPHARWRRASSRTHSWISLLRLRSMGRRTRKAGARRPTALRPNYRCPLHRAAHGAPRRRPDAAASCRASGPFWARSAELEVARRGSLWQSHTSCVWWRPEATLPQTPPPPVAGWPTTRTYPRL